MAKRRRGPNKSQAIRDYMAANSEAAPKQVQEGLAAQGITVTTQLISNTKSRSGAKTKRRGKKRGPKAKVGVENVSLAALLEAKKLVDRAGSVDVVRRALDALEKLR